MDLESLFESGKGFGVLATAGADGRVDAAVYSRPHVVAEDRVALIMADRLSHANLRDNPHAAYLFRADPEPSGSRYQGVRLFLTRIEEETDPEKIDAMQRRKYASPDRTRFLVTFRVDKVLPLVGPGEEDEAGD